MTKNDGPKYGFVETSVRTDEPRAGTPRSQSGFLLPGVRPGATKITVRRGRGWGNTFKCVKMGEWEEGHHFDNKGQYWGSKQTPAPSGRGAAQKKIQFVGLRTQWIWAPLHRGTRRGVLLKRRRPAAMPPFRSPVVMKPLLYFATSRQTSAHHRVICRQWRWGPEITSPPGAMTRVGVGVVTTRG